MIQKYSEDSIYTIAQNPSLMRQGKTIRNSKGVKSLYRDGNYIHGVIRSSRNEYKVSYLFIRNSITQVTCDCIDGRNEIPCRHVVAGMLSMEFDIPDDLAYAYQYETVLDFLCVIEDGVFNTQEELTLLQNSFEETPEILEISPFSNFLDSQKRNTDNRKPLKLQVILKLEENYYSKESDFKWILSLRVGLETLYVVKSINEFIDSYKYEKDLFFSKKFRFNPKEHRFNNKQKKLLEFIDSIRNVYIKKENGREYEHSYYSKYNDYEEHINGKHLTIEKDMFIKELLNVLKDVEFKLLVNQNYRENETTITHIIEGCPKLLVAVEVDSDEEKDLVVNFRENKRIVPLTKDYEYIYYNEELYHLSEEEAKIQMDIREMINAYGWKIEVTKKQKEQFFTAVYPVLLKNSEITIPKEYNEKIVNRNLITKVFFETTKSGGTLVKIKYVYGDIEILAHEKNKSRETDIYILRDIEKEARVMKFFEEFEEVNEGYYHDDEDFIYHFVNNKLELIKEIAELYFEKGLMSYKSQFPKIRSSIGLTTDDYLKVSFTGIQYSQLELEQIYGALKEKKTYVRLKDGSFLDVNEPEVEEYFDMIHELDIPMDQLEQQEFIVPIYRAFAFEKLSEDYDFQIDREMDYSEFLNRFKSLDRKDIPLSKEFEHVLRDYQKTGFQWLGQLDKYKLGGILADDMGLGKTLQTIALIDAACKEDLDNPGKRRPSLIVAPTSLVYNWEAEVAKFAPHLSVLIINGTQKERIALLKKAEDYTIIVTTYTLILRDIEIYSKMDFARCIIDEAQNIKNPSAKSTRAIKRIKASSYLALTGTPVENNLTELWSIFDFIMPGYLHSLKNFRETYEKPIGASDLEALANLKRHITPFIMRRMKKDVLKELPPKIETKSIAHMTKEQQKVYLAYLEKAKASMEEDI